MLKNRFLRVISLVFVWLTLFTSVMGITKTSSNNTQNTQTSSSVKETHSPYKKFAKRLGVSEKKISDLLTYEAEETKINLVPLVDSPEYLKLWEELFIKSSKKYMKYYAEPGELRTKKEAERDYYSRIAWQWNRKKPYSMTMVINFNGKPVGKTSIVSLVNFDDNNVTEIDYVLLEKFKSKGIMTRSIGLLLDFLRYLIKKEIYNFDTIKIIANNENIASQRVATKNGFVAKEGNITVHGLPSKDFRINLLKKEQEQKE